GPMALDPTLHGQAARAFVQQHYHLKDPIVSRYLRWAGGVLHHGFGDGVSLEVTAHSPLQLSAAGEPIGPELWRSAEITAAMVAGALILATLGSALVGSIAAKRRRFRADVSTRFLTYLAAAM